MGREGDLSIRGSLGQQGAFLWVSGGLKTCWLLLGCLSGTVLIVLEGGMQEMQIGQAEQGEGLWEALQLGGTVGSVTAWGAAAQVSVGRLAWICTHCPCSTLTFVPG